jgi:hypothetical protein
MESAYTKKVFCRPSSHQPGPAEWFNTIETAHQLGLQPKTLANMRSLGTGPPFHKIGGKVWYRGEDIISYRNRRKFIASGERDES